MVLRLTGGAGKKRRSDGDDSVVGGNRIQEVLGEVVVKDTDIAIVKEAIVDPVDIDAWIGNLSLKDVETLKDLTIKNEGRGFNDYVLLQYAKLLPTVAGVEATTPPTSMTQKCLFTKPLVFPKSVISIVFFMVFDVSQDLS